MIRQGRSIIRVKWGLLIIAARFGEEMEDRHGAEIDIPMQKGEKPAQQTSIKPLT
jgi:hypothetical protein